MFDAAQFGVSKCIPVPHLLTMLPWPEKYISFADLDLKLDLDKGILNQYAKYIPQR